MVDVDTMPTSVRRYRDDSNLPARQDRLDDPRAAMQAAVVELARTAPEMTALIVASAFGRSEFEMTLIEKHEYYERVKRKVLGFDCGEEFVPLSTTKTTTKRYVIR